MESKSIIKDLEYKREYKEYKRADGTTYTDADSYRFWETNVEVPIFKPEELAEVDEKTKTFSREVAVKFGRIFDYRECKLTDGQLKFSYDASLAIIGKSKNPDKITVIPAKAGFGKSSYIYALLVTLCSHIKKEALSKFSKKGMIIVTDRLNSLRELEKNITSEVGYYYEDDKFKTPYCYILESWNKHSYEEGICGNKYVKEFENDMCTYQKCGFYNNCKMSRQKKQQVYSPILFMTNARFKQYGEKIQEYSTWKDRNGVNQKREIVIIDEKPEIIDTVKIGTDLFTKLKESVELSKKEGLEDRKNWLLDELIKIENKVMQLRISLVPYRNCVWCGNGEQGITKEFRDCWSEIVGFKNISLVNAIDKMFSQGAVWCNCNSKYAKPYFCTLGLKNLDFDGFNTFIFDATSELDPDYRDDMFQYLSIDDMKDYSNITFHIFQDKIMNMSRSAININNHPWKIEAVIKWINKTAQEKTFVVTYNSIAKQLSSGLEGLGHNIFTDADEKEAVVPHFGDTKGSNDFKEAKCMIQIGWNKTSTDEYLTSSMSRNTDLEKVFTPKDSKIEKTAEAFKIKNGKFIDYDSANLYMWKRLMVDFEQEVFRTSIRDFSANNPVEIYIFYPDSVLIGLIFQRFKGCKVLYHKEIPDEFSQEKVLSRKTPDGNPNILQNFFIWLKDFWDGQKISVADIKLKFHISDGYWDKLIQNKIIMSVREEKNIQNSRTGKGENQVYYWHIP